MTANKDVVLIFATDHHLKGVNPSARIDSYPQAILDKITWIDDYAHQVGADAIIAGGDWLDNAFISLSLVAKLIVAIRRNNNKYLTILGNHDRHGGPASDHRIIMGFLCQFGFMHLLSDTDPYIIGDRPRINVWGKSYYYGIENDDLVVPTQPGINIIAAHSMILPSQSDVISPSIPAELVRTNCDLVLSGHYHQPFCSAAKESGAVIISPGSVSRSRQYGDNLWRMPQVLRVTIPCSGPPEIKMIEISVAKPASEIFDLAALEESKEREKNLEDLTRRLSHGNSIDTAGNMLSLLQRIERAYNSNSIEKDVYQDITSRIEVLPREEESNV